MSKNITLLGASYSDVPAVRLPVTGGGTADFTDVSDTTATAADVAQGKYFYLSDGTRAAGTSSGGGGSANIGTASVSNSSNTATSLSFTVSGEPLVFFVRITTTITSSGSTSYYYVASMRYNGSDTYGTYMRIGSTRGIYNDTSHYSFSYSGSTLTVRSSASRTTAGGSFYNGTYELTYVY